MFENCTVKLSAKETKWTLLEVRTHPTILENLISKYDFGPVKLPGLSRNGPQALLFGLGTPFNLCIWCIPDQGKGNKGNEAPNK